MKKYFITFTCGLIFLLPQAHATLLSGIDASLGGTTPLTIISTPSSMFDDLDGGVLNFGQQGFNERQSVTLTSDLIIDGGIIAAGNIVNSQMIFLNPDISNTIGFHGAEWTFGENILGVISTSSALDDSDYLGAVGTLYPSNIASRGLEDIISNGVLHKEEYNILGDTLAIDMHVSRSSGAGGEDDLGDWVRVITAGSIASVPEPLSLTLLASGLLILAGFVFPGNRRSRQ